ncbi:MAG: hypothetical protein ACRDQY_26635 [Pseudonocardiaceae bacterium]
MTTGNTQPTQDDINDQADDGPHRVHLVAADSGLVEGHPACRLYMGSCGALMTRSQLPSSLCPDGCECAGTFCQHCLDVANEHNYDAGVDVQCPPGMRVETTR